MPTLVKSQSYLELQLSRKSCDGADSGRSLDFRGTPGLLPPESPADLDALGCRSPIVIGFTNDFVNAMAMGLTSPRQLLVKLAVVPDNQIAPIMDQGIN